MKNKILNTLFYIFTILITFLITIPAFALEQTGIVDATLGLKVRSNAGTSYSVITTLKHKTQVTILDSKKTSDSSIGCPSGTWYYISVGSTKGYACSDYIIPVNNSNTEVTPSEMAQMTDAEFDNYLNSQGFPSSYSDLLKKLHKSHPNWVFKGVNAKYSWSSALSEQNAKKRSLYQVTSTGVKNGLQGYLNTGSDYYNYETDKFTALDGTTWYQANSDTIAYFMDPRNFLTESGIFMFEDLTYNQSYHTSELVKKVLYTDFYKNYIQYYMSAAQKSNVSPVYLATLSRQEVGLNASTATSGNAGTYNGVNYNGYYNFFNIGATSGTYAVYNGLAYAKEQGWNTPEKAILGGASWIVNGYISRGQYTRYFQKWNVSPTTTTGIWHQYMTDIHALVGPSANAAASYSSMNIINEPLVFTIPIYSGMPSKTSLPPTGNPNNWLKDLKVDSKTVSGFKGSTTSYDLGTVENSKSSINISTTTVNSNASVSVNGNVNLSTGKNTINLIVTAQNGAKRTYTITITRKAQDNNNDEPNTPTTTEISVSKIISNLSLKNTNNYIYGFQVGTTTNALSQNILKQNSKAKVTITGSDNKTKTGTIATGDKLTITSNNETKTYQIVIYGDMNGDGKIDAKDLLIMRKYLLKEKTLSGAYLESAKLTKASSITAKDLLLLRKHLLGTQKISQV